MASTQKIKGDVAIAIAKDGFLRIKPRRIYMFLAGVIIGIFGVLAILGGILGVVKALSEGEILDGLQIALLGIFGVFLVGIARMAFMSGMKQKSATFDPKAKVVHVGKDQVFAFDDVIGVYYRSVGQTRIGRSSSVIVETGLVVNQQTIPLMRLSQAKLDQVMENTILLVRLYTEYLGYHPDQIGRYEDLFKRTASNSATILSFKESQSVSTGYRMPRLD